MCLAINQWGIVYMYGEFDDPPPPPSLPPVYHCFITSVHMYNTAFQTCPFSTHTHTHSFSFLPLYIIFYSDSHLTQYIPHNIQSCSIIKIFS